MRIVIVQRAAEGNFRSVFLDPARHQVDYDISRTFRVETVLYFFAETSAEIAVLHARGAQGSVHAAELQRESGGAGLHFG